MLKFNEVGVVLDIVNGYLPDDYIFPIPDPRSNKPEILFDKKTKHTHLIQRLVETEAGSTSFGLAIPNEIALALSVAGKAQSRAVQLRNKVLQHARQVNGSLHKQEVVDAYDYLEQIQTCIVFSYKSVEAFCNASIPDDFVYTRTNSKGILEHYPKQQIERWINTSEKVSKILPTVLSTQDPNQESFWSGFQNLERMRNEIMHSKSSSSAKILAELFSDAVDDYVRASRELLHYFIKTDSANPIFPFGFGKSSIQSFEIEDITLRFTHCKKMPQDE
ncbi:MAG: hypothetical protein R3C17_00350 [Planctomycetaceae bacterium]